MGNIALVLGKTIERIRELYSPYRHSTVPAVLTFEPGLSTIVTALTELEDWVLNNLESTLDSDFNKFISCCRLLVGIIDGELAKVRSVDGRLVETDTLGSIFWTKDAKDVQAMIELSVEGLTLLLADYR